MPTGEGKGAVNRRKQFCPWGHEYTPENTYEPPSGGRFCRECGRRRSREWRERNQEKARASSREYMARLRAERREQAGATA